MFAFFLALGIAFIVVGFFGLIRVTDWRDRPKGVVQLPAKPVETFLAEEIITRTRRVKATRG